MLIVTETMRTQTDIVCALTKKILICFAFTYGTYSQGRASDIFLGRYFILGNQCTGY